MASVTAVMVMLLAFGAFAGATRAGQGLAAARGVGAAVFLAIVVWLTITAGLSVAGLLDTSAWPPRWPLLPLAAFAAIAWVTRSVSAKRIFSHLPFAWPIATQAFRVGVELALHFLHTSGRAPVQITFEGRNVDILVGLSAPLIAWLVATNRIGARGALAWNFLGLVVLANAVGTLASSAPGPLHLDWPGEPFTAITTWPIVWLPAFLMPAAVFLHIISVKQNLHRLRTQP